MSLAKTNCAAFGNVGKGVDTQLVSLGAESTFLVRGASVTFWRFRYVKHTPFAISQCPQLFDQVKFGGQSKLKLQKRAECVWATHMAVHLPGIYARRRFKRSATALANSQRRSNNGEIKKGAEYYQALAARDHQPYSTQDPGYQDAEYYASIGDNMTDSADLEHKIYKGKDAWLRQVYGGSINQEIDDMNAEDEVEMEDEEEPWVHWAQAAGQAVIQQIKMSIGNQEVDNLFSEYLFMWEALAGCSGKRLGELVGHYKTKAELLKAAQTDQILYVPLPFSFTQTPGNALPLINLKKHDVRFYVQWENLDKMLIVSHTDVKVYKAKNHTPLSEHDLYAYLDCHFVHLDYAERAKFYRANFDQLISQVQHIRMTHNKVKEFVVPLRFRYPIIELIWAVRRERNYNLNRLFDFSGLDNRDPIVSVELRFNGCKRIAQREGSWYRKIPPLLHHRCIPKGFIYCYSFAIWAEEPQPTGSCTFTGIKDIDFEVKLQKGLEEESVEFMLFGRNWNVGRYVDGEFRLLL